MAKKKKRRVRRTKTIRIGTILLTLAAVRAMAPSFTTNVLAGNFRQLPASVDMDTKNVGRNIPKVIVPVVGLMALRFLTAAVGNPKIKFGSRALAIF